MKNNKIISVWVVFSLVVINIVACIKSDSREPPPVIDPCSGTPGPLFTAVKNLIATKCLGCHNSTRSSGGTSFTIECDIVTKKTRIKVRAVDQGDMPPGGTLSATDKTIITRWINAGGRYRD